MICPFMSITLPRNAYGIQCFCDCQERDCALWHPGIDRCALGHDAVAPLMVLADISKASKRMADALERIDQAFLRAILRAQP